MTSALSVYETGLLSLESTHMVRKCGTRHRLPVSTWMSDAGPADEALLAGCEGPTLDIGCGPGRLTVALTARGVPSLGIDVSPLSVQMTIERGGMAICGDVFDSVPGFGRWEHILLADGNIGIGGDPLRLLRRCRDLLGPGGDIRLDLQPPGDGLLTERIRLESRGVISSSFRWCWVGVDALPAIAASAGLSVADLWQIDDRWQGRLIPAP